MRRKETHQLTITAILVAFGILIPLMMPIKIIIGPASFTLASHVPIFIAMFLSPWVAVLVALGTSLGFLWSGFPLVIVLRALSHVIFALVGALVLKSSPKLLENPLKTLILALGLNLLHAAAECLCVYLLTGTGQTDSSYLYTLFGLVGIGTLIHGMVDFYLALFFWNFLKKTLKLDLSL